MHWLAEDLQAGDVFTYDGVELEVIRASEPFKDILGRDLLAHWCKRADTGQEGYMPFGPGGVFH